MTPGDDVPGETGGPVSGDTPFLDAVAVGATNLRRWLEHNDLWDSSGAWTGDNAVYSLLLAVRFRPADTHDESCECDCHTLDPQPSCGACGHKGDERTADTHSRDEKGAPLNPDGWTPFMDTMARVMDTMARVMARQQVDLIDMRRLFVEAFNLLYGARWLGEGSKTADQAWHRHVGEFCDAHEALAREVQESANCSTPNLRTPVT